MATRTAKLRIELDGEKKYKEAIAEINRESKTLGAEMKKLAAEYKGNEDSVEALTKKQTLLDRALLESKAKVEETRKQLDSWRAALERVRQEQGASSDEYKAAQKKVQEYEAALANAETQEINLQRAVNDTNAAIKSQGDDAEQSGEKMQTLGDQVQTITDKLGIKLPEGAKKALDGMDSLSAGTVAAMGAIAAGVTVAVKAVEALYDMTVESAYKVDELNSRATKTGLDADLLQKLDYAQLFIDFDNLDGTLVKLTQNMAKARDGAEAQAAAFDALGVSVVNEDGTLRDNWDTFLELIDALGQVGNETERDTLANDVFGRSYSDLKPLIDAGTDALEDYMQKAEELGIVLDEQEREKLQRLSDILDDNKARWEALKDHLSLIMAPVFSFIIDKINDVITALTTLADWIESVTDKISRLGDLLRSTDFSSVSAMSNSSNYGFGVNASGTDNWRGGLTWVGEAGPELVALPKGSQIYSNQESRSIAQPVVSSTDLSRVEMLLTDVLSALRDKRVIARMG